MYIKRNTVLVILGMHRSGTSAISGILDLLNFNSGRSVLPPQPDNPKGFFENKRIVDFNDKCLARLGASWSETFLLEETWWENDTISELAGELAQILKEELGFLNPSFLKDPRLCVLLPLYLRVFSQLGITPYFIVCLRNPSEIAHSLKHRNYFTEERTMMLWLDYMLKAEIYSRNHARGWIDFNTLVSNPLSIVERIFKESGYAVKVSKEKSEEIGHFIESSLKHHNDADIDASHLYIPEIALFYQSLMKLKDEGGSPGTYLAIDHLRQAFYKKYAFFHALSHPVNSRLKSFQDPKENIDLVENVKMGVNLWNFDLYGHGEINRLVFIPANIETCFVFNSISVTDEENRQIPFTAKSGGQTSVFIGELIVYKHEGQMILFEFEQPLKPKNIRLTVTYYAFGDSVKELKVTPDACMSGNLELLQRKLHLVLLSNEENPANPQSILREYNNRLARQATQIKEQSEIINQQLQQVQLLSDTIRQQSTAIQDLSLKITEQNHQLTELSDSNTSCLNVIRINELHIQSLVSSWTWKVGKVILWPAHFIFIKILVPINSKIQAHLKTSGHH